MKLFLFFLGCILVYINAKIDFPKNVEGKNKVKVAEKSPTPSLSTELESDFDDDNKNDIESGFQHKSIFWPKCKKGIVKNCRPKKHPLKKGGKELLCRRKTKKDKCGTCCEFGIGSNGKCKVMTKMVRRDEQIDYDPDYAPDVDVDEYIADDKNNECDKSYGDEE